MNTWQVLAQAQTLLRALQWDSEPVFQRGSVIISKAPPMEAIQGLDWPAVILSAGPGQADPQYREERGLLNRVIDVTLFVANNADALGEAALMGANRVGAEDSRGKGLYELEEQLYAALGLLTAENGVRIFLAGNQHGGAETDAEGVTRTWVTHSFEALVSVCATYQEPTGMYARDEKNGGDVFLSWTLPGARFDFTGVFLRRAAGTQPPLKITDGVDVPLSGAFPTDHLDSPGTGPWAYSLFAQYDLGGGVFEYSNPATTVVTAT